MDTASFKSLFNDVATSHDFKRGPGGWYKQLPTALFVLDLQKSNFGNYYELNMKLFLHQQPPADRNAFKKLFTSLSGDIFRRQPNEYNRAFDLDDPSAQSERRTKLDDMFSELIDRICLAAIDKRGILQLRDEGILYLLPGVESRL